MAAARHGGQRRDVDDAPFILHPLEVGALLSGRDHDDEVVAAGLLHDVVEDTDASIDEVRARFGDRVAGIVAAVTEDPAIADYEERKAALRDAVSVAGADARAVYAADKVVKARELRAKAAGAEDALADAEVRRRLDHYERSVAMLLAVDPRLALARQLEFELWALRNLPPGRQSRTSGALGS